MKEFIRIRNDGTSEFCYLVDIKFERSDKKHFVHAHYAVYYGQIITGHENKEATAVMVLDYFNALIKKGLIIGIKEIEP